MRYSPHKKYGTCEAFEVLDINWLKRHSRIPSEDKLPIKDSLYWKSSNGLKSSVHMIGLNNRLLMFYSRGDESIKDEIFLEWQSISLKHTVTLRPWLLCPSCNGRKAKLYLHNKYFRCKDCHDLVNRSSQSSRMARESKKARNILKLIGYEDECNILQTSELYSFMRPKGMHSVTFERLQTEYREARNKMFELSVVFRQRM